MGSMTKKNILVDRKVLSNVAAAQHDFVPQHEFVQVFVVE
jgi:ribosomal protein L20